MRQKLLRIMLLCCAFCLALLAGCGADTNSAESEDQTKQTRVEIYSAQDDELLTSIENQETIDELLQTYNWDTRNALPDDLVEEYKIVVYQETTLLWGQNPDDEREYELIETITTFQDSEYVKEVIAGDVIKNMDVPEEVLTSYYVMPDEAVKELHLLVREEA